MHDLTQIKTRIEEIQMARNTEHIARVCRGLQCPHCDGETIRVRQARQDTSQIGWECGECGGAWSTDRYYPGHRQQPEMTDEELLEGLAKLLADSH